MKINQIIRYSGCIGACYYGCTSHPRKFIAITLFYACHQVYRNIDSIKEIYKECVFTWEEMTPWRYHRDKNPHLYDEQGYLKK